MLPLEESPLLLRLVQHFDDIDVHFIFYNVHGVFLKEGHFVLTHKMDYNWLSWTTWYLWSSRETLATRV